MKPPQRHHFRHADEGEAIEAVRDRGESVVIAGRADRSRPAPPVQLGGPGGRARLSDRPGDRSEEDPLEAARAIVRSGCQRFRAPPPGGPPLLPVPAALLGGLFEWFHN